MDSHSMFFGRLFSKAAPALVFLVTCSSLFGDYEKINPRVLPVKEVKYQFKKAPIDVVIPCAGKDKPTLELCIDGIRKYGKNVNRIIVVSDKQYSDSAEWFDEKLFPFTKLDIIQSVFQSKVKGQAFVKEHPGKTGWIYQQFLKLYAPFVIPKISPNVLVLDSDTVFLRPVTFTHKNRGIFTVSDEYHPPYFDWMQRSIPWLTKLFSQYSGVSHHMLLQRPVLHDLFTTIKTQHKDLVWKSLSRAIDQTLLPDHSSLSEYELYFNFALSKSKDLRVRRLKWKNVATLQEIETARSEDYDFVSCHSWMRE